MNINQNSVFLTKTLILKHHVRNIHTLSYLFKRFILKPFNIVSRLRFKACILRCTSLFLLNDSPVKLFGSNYIINKQSEDTIIDLLFLYTILSFNSYNKISIL